MKGFRKIAPAFLMLLALSGCATSGHPRDPLEGYNRTVFALNDKVDQAVLRPVATAYQDVTPLFLQTSISNFFGNLGDVWNAVNNLLQGNLEAGVTDVMRVAVNTVLGFGGLLDIASEAGMTKHNEDFGQTLGVWGMPAGPYLVLPLLGPSTFRDAAALSVDGKGDPLMYVDPVRARNVGLAVRVIDQRAALLDASTLLEEVALDKYSFVRDAWLQRRDSMIGVERARPSEPREEEEDSMPPAKEPREDAVQENEGGSASDVSPDIK